jgi:hypothetical protein
MAFVGAFASAVDGWVAGMRVFFLIRDINKMDHRS